MAITFLDTFTEASDTNLELHTPDIGTGWSKEFGQFFVRASDNNVEPTTDVPAAALSDDIGTPNNYVQYITPTPSSADRGAFVCTRYVDGDNWIGIGIHPTIGNQIIIYKNVAGVLTALGSGAVTTNGSTYKLEADGSTLRLFKDDVQVGSDISETAHMTATRQGLYATVDVWKNWNTEYEAGTLGGGATPTGTTTITNVTPTETTASVDYSYDAADQTGFNYRLDGGAAVDVGLTNPFVISGLTENTSYTVEVQAYNVSGGGTWSTPATSFTTDAAVVPTITTEPLRNNTGELLDNEVGIIADVYNISTGALVVRKTGLTSDTSGVVTFSDALMSALTEYRVVITLSINAEGLDRITTS